MKSFVFSILLVLPMSVFAGDVNDEAGSAATAAATAWLSLTDKGQFEASWDSAAPYFQAAVTKSDWERSLNAARAPLGETLSREVASSRVSTTLPGAPDGEYVVVGFSTSFANKMRATETVTTMRGDDGNWRVAGYFIR
jgi:hypothetical protein